MNARLACVSYKDHADSPDANATVFWTPSGNFHERSAARHERWLKDSDELLRAAPVRLLELPPCSKPLRGTSVTAGTLTAADVECLTWHVAQGKMHLSLSLSHKCCISEFTLWSNMTLPCLPHFGFDFRTDCFESIRSDEWSLLS
eukprot:TRINITY_DN20436_c0_g1_i1.p1 TRINITY_DN20436_c0_g1~~TRINITY_DN20436_c0_g1_i1.p1  ORF type:complete len:161 (+),score=13.28 TRINITY_DN20436_c0_g1_i1:49-483(+)